MGTKARPATVRLDPAELRARKEKTGETWKQIADALRVSEGSIYRANNEGKSIEVRPRASRSRASRSRVPDKAVNAALSRAQNGVSLAGAIHDLARAMRADGTRRVVVDLDDGSFEITGTERYSLND